MWRNPCGPVLNATLSWAGPTRIARLVIAGVVVRELEAWRGEGCCSRIATAAGCD